MVNLNDLNDFAILLIFFGLPIGSVGVVFLVSFLYNSRRQKRWQNLAQLNHLTFIPGRFYGGYHRIIGDDSDYEYTISFDQRLFVTYLELSRKPKHKNGRTSQITMQEVLRLLTPTGSPYSYKGLVKAEPTGKKIYYKQFSVESDIEYLQFLLDQLRILATVYPKMVALGVETIPTLETIAANTLNGLHLVALQLLKDVAEETREKFGYRTRQVWCPHCFTFFGRHQITPLFLQPVFYYGCRNCHQSQTYLEGQVVMVLDDDMTTEYLQRNGRIQINWFHSRQLFDFEQVEIVNTTDEDVERFAVQVGNDTDVSRNKHYKRMICVVSSDCKLTDNTQKVLKQTFGQLEIKELQQS